MRFELPLTHSHALDRASHPLLQMTLVDHVKIEPRLLNRHLRRHVQQALIRKVEGQWRPDTGYIISVIGFPDLDQSIEVDKGVIDNTDGSVRFSVPYEAIVLRPFYNEVLSCVVRSVGPMMVTVFVGPMEINIDRSKMPEDFVYDDSDPSNPQWKGSEYSIGVGSLVKVRVVKVTSALQGVVVTGTMRGDYLG